MKKNSYAINIGDISLIVYDFDGVMTDNRVMLFEDGREAVLVNRSDGMAISIIKGLGVRQIIISSETNPVVKARAKKLGIPFIQSSRNKKITVMDYIHANAIKKDRVVFIGNDINDKDAMESIGHPVAPSDAHPSIKRIAKIVLSTKGGYGVVREFLGRINGNTNEG